MVVKVIVYDENATVLMDSQKIPIKRNIVEFIPKR